MADVTISNLTYGIPGNASVLPFSNGLSTLKVSPSSIHSARGSKLLIGIPGDISYNPYPSGQNSLVMTRLSSVDTYSMISSGGWCLSVTDKNSWWGDSSARIGVWRQGASNFDLPWFMSHNIDGNFSIHQTYDVPAPGGDRLIINPAGHITTPSQPTFRVSIQQAGGGNQGNMIKVPFNYAMLNVGNYFDLANSRFVVPTAGNYHFIAGHMNSQNNSGYGTIVIKKNSVQQCWFHNINSHPMSTSWSIIIPCNVGDIIEMFASNYHFSGQPENGYDYPVFMGYLLG